MSNLIRLGEEYRLKFLPKCWEDTDRLLTRRSWKRAVLACLVVIGWVVLELETHALRTKIKYR